jgi:hypothetical protein
VHQDLEITTSHVGGRQHRGNTQAPEQVLAAATMASAIATMASSASTVAACSAAAASLGSTGVCMGVTVALAGMHLGTISLKGLDHVRVQSGKVGHTTTAQGQMESHLLSLRGQSELQSPESPGFNPHIWGPSCRGCSQVSPPLIDVLQHHMPGEENALCSRGVLCAFKTTCSAAGYGGCGNICGEQLATWAAHPGFIYSGTISSTVTGTNCSSLSWPKVPGQSRRRISGACRTLRTGAQDAFVSH